jgi:hypothetical protein
LRFEFINLFFIIHQLYQVPYYESIVDVKSNVNQKTASVIAQEYIKSEEELTRGHLPLNSFSDHAIVRDARFRLAEALARANVQHTDAARDAVLRLNPRPHLAIHGLL